MLSTLESSWQEILKDEFKKAYFKELLSFLEYEYKTQTIYPKKEDLFNAFSLTPFDKVKVVIIGQDPYHGVNQAHGLAFSVQNGIKHPPSLQNILKELHSDLNYSLPTNGNLSSWAKNGVFLINAILSVRASMPKSHANKGWEEFIDSVIVALNKHKNNLVFILWGSPAIAKSKLIDKNRHLILSSVHPSPLSAYRGFFGSKPFSTTNKFLKSKNIDTINWSLA